MSQGDSERVTPRLEKEQQCSLPGCLSHCPAGSEEGIRKPDLKTEKGAVCLSVGKEDILSLAMNAARLFGVAISTPEHRTALPLMPPPLLATPLAVIGSSENLEHSEDEVFP